jgi:hypothetical protein
MAPVVDDATLTAKVKTRLRGERLAQLTEGVRGVVNQLTVEGRAASAMDERPLATAAPAASPPTGFIGHHTGALSRA